LAAAAAATATSTLAAATTAAADAVTAEYSPSSQRKSDLTPLFPPRNTGKTCVRSLPQLTSSRYAERWDKKKYFSEEQILLLPFSFLFISFLLYVTFDNDLECT
jgi:hypothetical protein